MGDRRVAPESAADGVWDGAAARRMGRRRSSVALVKALTRRSSEAALATVQDLHQGAQSLLDRFREAMQMEAMAPRPIQGRSLLLLPPSNPLRQLCHRLSVSRQFDALILTCILVNIVIMAVQDPLADPLDMTDSLAVVDIVISGIFALELSVKVVALGLWRGPHTYLMVDNWNRLDFLVVVSSMLMFTGGLLPRLSAFRALRGLRTLRSIRYFSEIRAIIDSLSYAAPLVLNVAVLMVFFLLVFGIFGVESMHGSYRRRCVVDVFDPALNETTRYVSEPAMMCSKFANGGFNQRTCPSYQTCQLDYGNPVNNINFDNVANAGLLLFQVMSLDGWAPGLMHPMMQSEYKLSFVYFVGAIVFMVFLVLNLFVAVITTSFSRVRSETGRTSAFMTEQTPRPSVADSESTAQTEARAALAAMSRANEVGEGDDDGADDDDDDDDDLDVLELPEDEELGRVRRSRVLDAPPRREPWLRVVVLSQRFDTAVTACIVVNTLFLALEHHGQADSTTTMLKVAEVFFTLVFFLEMLLKVFALKGVRSYLSDTANVFDMIIVINTTVSLVLEVGGGGGGADETDGFTALRVFRVFRVSRLLVKWERLRVLLEAVVGSLKPIANLLVFLMFNLVVVSILALQLYGGQIDDARHNYDGFGRSFLTMFQVLTGDQWANVLVSTMGADANSALAAPFLVAFFVFGNFVLLNMFVAVILESFALNEAEAARLLEMTKATCMPLELKALEQRKTMSDFMSAPRKMGRAGYEAPRRRSSFALSPMELQQASAPRRVRALAADLLDHRWFDRFILVVIVVSGLLLALDSPHEYLMSDADREMQRVVDLVGLVVLAVFVFEFLVRVTAMGFMGTPTAYLSDSFNRLDFFVLLTSLMGLLVDTMTEGGSEGEGAMLLSISRVLRVARVLRPLRLLGKNAGMRVIVHALLACVPAVANVLALAATLFLIFAILGVSLFAGQFYSCNDATALARADCFGHFVDPDSGVAMPRTWTNARSSFDHVGSGLLTLLEVAALKWVDTLNNAMDAVGVDAQPQTDASRGNAAFFIAFVFIGGFFTVNLFVGVLVDQFQRSDGTSLMTASQKNWVELERMLQLFRPKKQFPDPARGSFRHHCLRLYQHPWFDRVVTGMIVVNTGFMLSFSYGASQAWLDVLSTANYVFLVLFALEFVVKITALLPPLYFGDAWNAFDFAIVLGSVVSLLLPPEMRVATQTARIFRVLRVFRFAKRSKGVRSLFQTLRVSIPSMANLMFLMLLVLFVFAVVGRQMFGGTKYGDFHNSHANFRTFGMALLTLFQCMCGDDWHAIMRDLQLSEPACIKGTDCGSEWGAVCFFVSFYVTVVFIFVNLFVAVILDNFQSCFNKVNSTITIEHFEQFQLKFQEFDDNNDGTFPLSRLAEFLSALDPPLRVESHTRRVDYLRIRAAVHRAFTENNSVAVDGVKPPFQALLYQLCLHHMGIRCLPYHSQEKVAREAYKIYTLVTLDICQSYVRAWRTRHDLRHGRVARYRDPDRAQKIARAREARRQREAARAAAPKRHLFRGLAKTVATVAIPLASPPPEKDLDDERPPWSSSTSPSSSAPAPLVEAPVPPSAPAALVEPPTWACAAVPPVPVTLGSSTPLKGPPGPAAPTRKTSEPQPTRPSPLQVQEVPISLALAAPRRSDPGNVYRVAVEQPPQTAHRLQGPAAGAFAADASASSPSFPSSPASRDNPPLQWSDPFR